jgi:DNA-directed RNA polymerase subunit L
MKREARALYAGISGCIRFKETTRVGGAVNMPIKVLLREKNELRLRFIGENHTSLQLFRQRCNDHKNVDYSNYFPGHPDLDEPEFYLRTKGNASAEKVLKDLCSDLVKDFSKTSL